MTFDPERHFKRKAEVHLAGMKYARAAFGNTRNDATIAKLETALNQINAGASVYVALADCLTDLK